jgi:carboxymethylenebutenolidase
LGTKISFKRPDGKEASGYLAKAAHANGPGVVVIQEWWGVQDQIKGICDRFAAAGYNALAPDLYAGTVVPYHDTDAANKEMSSLNFLEATDQAVRGAAQYLKATEVKVGLTGFCLGGAVTIIGSVRVPEFAAGVCFYGLPPAEAAKPADIRVPLQAHFANQDDWCTPKAVDGFEAGVKAAGKAAEIFRYDAKHGFMNEQRLDVHDRKAAELAWDRTLAFWKKHLAG